MNSFVRVISIAAVAVNAGCAASDFTQPLGPDLSIVRLRAEPYSFTYSSGFDQPARLVVRDAATWQVVWNKIYLRELPVPALPAIDFSRDMIVVAALGSRSSGGYSILLDGAAEGPDGIAIAVNSISPGPGCGVSTAFTQPVDIARLPLRQGAVSFVERSHVSDCQ